MDYLAAAAAKSRRVSRLSLGLSFGNCTPRRPAGEEMRDTSSWTVAGVLGEGGGGRRAGAGSESGKKDYPNGGNNVCISDGHLTVGTRQIGRDERGCGPGTKGP